MKKIIAGLMIAAAAMSFGCGRNAQFGVVDLQQVDKEAVALKTIKEDTNKKLKDMEAEMIKAMDGKNVEEQKKVVEDYTAKANLVKSEAQNKIKSSLDTALNAVAKEKNLGAIMVKQAVPQGGTDVTKEVIEKMK